MSGRDPDDTRRRSAPEGALDDASAALEALRAAHAPRELDADVHEAILARALGEAQATASDLEPASHDPSMAPVTPGERARATALRAALEGEPTDPESLALVALARALRHAHEPRPLVELHHEAILRDALRRRSALRWVATGAAAALAAAAAAVLSLSAPSAPGPGVASLVPSRSTTELFDPAEPFPRTGDETARIDKIAGVRASDLRANRYATWGVR